MKTLLKDQWLDDLCRHANNIDGYEGDTKERWLQAGKKALKALVKELNNRLGKSEIRFCKGGPAVPGEIILHTELMYMQLCHSSLFSGQPCIMYRACDGLKDYGANKMHAPYNNHWAKIERIYPENLREFAQELVDEFTKPR